MIYVTGDCHGDFSQIERFCENKKTTKDDIIIILGDACLNYHENSKDFKLKRALERLPITFFFIHGNHEIRPIHINTYKPHIWNNGKVYSEDKYPSLIFAEDGEIYNLCNKKILVIGGAYSVDKYYRVGNGLLWQSDEQPTKENINKAWEKLKNNKMYVDYVMTHTCPLSFIPEEAFCTEIDQTTVDKRTEIEFDKIYNKIEFKKWYCGHYHIDKNNDKLSFVYNRIFALK